MQGGLRVCACTYAKHDTVWADQKNKKGKRFEHARDRGHVVLRQGGEATPAQSVFACGDETSHPIRVPGH